MITKLISGTSEMVMSWLRGEIPNEDIDKLAAFAGCSPGLIVNIQEHTGCSAERAAHVLARMSRISGWPPEQTIEYLRLTMSDAIVFHGIASNWARRDAHLITAYIIRTKA